MNPGNVNLGDLSAVARPGSLEEGALPTVDEWQKALQELQVYRTEFDIQYQWLLKKNAELSAAATHYQSIFVGLPMPAMVCDDQGFILESNQAAIEMLDFRDRGMGFLHHSLLKRVDELHRPALQAALSPTGKSTNSLVGPIFISSANAAPVRYDAHIIRLSPESSSKTTSLVALVASPAGTQG